MILLFRNLHLTQSVYKPQNHSKKKQHAPPCTNSWLPCQRELACGKARLFQILLLFVTHATSKSRKPYLPSRLRDRRPDYLHFRKHRQPRTIPRPALPKIQIYRRRRSPQLFIIHYSLFIKQKVRAFSDNGPRYKISM